MKFEKTLAKRKCFHCKDEIQKGMVCAIEWWREVKIFVSIKHKHVNLCLDCAQASIHNNLEKATALYKELYSSIKYNKTISTNIDKEAKIMNMDISKREISKRG